MKPTYGIRSAADRDLDAIADYLGRHNFNAGLRFLQSVRSDCLFLSQFPGAGSLRRRVPKVLRGLRSWPVKGFRNYLIFYLPVPGGIDVIRVLHGARRIGRLLRQTVE